MRKKSHVSLARYLVDRIDEQELTRHRKAFCLGSILPDCKPSFLTTKHEMQGTFEQVQAEIYRLSQGEDVANMRAYFRDLGQVVHYIADYFTFPHNPHYEGSLREHCQYEKWLKQDLREYIGRLKEVAPDAWPQGLNTPEAICELIRRQHDAYLRRKTNVQEDCRQIVFMCYLVVAAVIQLFYRQQQPYSYAA